MGEPIEIKQPGIDLADDVIGADEPLVERGGPGSGFFEHVGREGELGGSAPEGSAAPVGREPLPSARDAEREPPTLVKDVETEGPITSDEISEYFQLMSEVAMHLPPDAEALWLATTEDFTYREEKRSAREKKDPDYQTEFEEERKTERAEARLKELVPLWGQMKFNMDFYELADFASEAKLQELDAIGERIERMTSDVEPEWTSSYDDEESEDYQIWQDYEGLLPNHILQNDYAVDQARAVLTHMSVFTDPAVSLDPYYDGESRLSYINMNLGMGDHESLETLHPEAKRAVGEAWRELAMTEGTPENATALRYGGPKPKMWIETMAAELTEKQWMPTDHMGGDYEMADLLNAGWQQSTNTPGGQLGMESAARLFGESHGAEAPPRERNEVIQKTADIEKSEGITEFNQPYGNFKLGYEKYEEMTGLEIERMLDDPDTQEGADKVLQGMYDDTQQWYADRGFSPDDRVPLYRGMGHITSEWNPSGEESAEGGDANVEMYSLSSWTAHVPETKAFVGDEEGAVVKAYIPVKNILVNPQTGFPCKEEREIVVIGGPEIRGTVYEGDTDHEGMVHDLSPDYDSELGYMTTGNTRQIIKEYLESAAWYETPDYTELVERQDVPQAAEATRVIEVDLEDADWIAEKLATAKLTKNMVDGLSNIGPDGEEVEEEEIERRRKIYEGQKRAMEVRNERQIDDDTRMPVEMTPEGGAIFQILVEEPDEEPVPYLEDGFNESGRDNDFRVEGAEEEPIVERGGKGSGFYEHVGREGEQGGSAPEGTSGPVSNRPGVEAYGSAVFTPLLHDIVIGWSDQPGYQVAALIENNVRQAQERGDDDYHGLAIGQDGILMGIGAMDYSAEFPEGYGDGLKPEDYLKIDGLYTVEAGFSEELMVQMAMEANRNGKGVWMEMGDEAGVLAAQMGMDVSDDGKYAHWTPEQAAEVAEKLQGLEQVDYVSPPTKPRVTMAFDDVWEEEVASNPVPDDREPPMPVSEMPIDERYRWENFNYSRWATADRWDPREFGKEQLGYEPTEEGEEEEFISSVYDSRVLEDLQSIHDGWIEGTHSPWSVRLSEAVADRFGGEPVPQARTREQFKTPIEFLDALGSEYGSDVVVGDIEMSEFRELPENEQWARLDEFSDFASGARQVDIATDIVSAVDAIYEKTQAEFKAAGYQEGDTVRLYRGLKANPEERLDGHDGGWVDLQQWSVSSWSAGKAVASNFASAPEEGGTAGQGTLLTADIPIEKILANWQTGPGSHEELEYLVIGSEPISAYATKITEAQDPEAVAEDKRMDADGVYEYGTEIE